MNLKCMIIDDEPLARQGLAEHIHETAFLDLVGTAESPSEAWPFIQTHSIDLLFLDIRMPGMSGIDFLKQFPLNIPVIISSAYDHYALEGFELDVIDYLLKPVTFERFTKAALKARDFIALNKSVTNKETGTSNHLFIKSDQQLFRIAYQDIRYVEAAGNYVIIHSMDRKHLVYTTLKLVESMLPKNQFIKVHKSFIVPFTSIESIQGEKIILGHTCIPIGRSFKKQLSMRLKNVMLKR